MNGNRHLDGETHLYAVALGSNRRHAAHGAPSGVIAAALARLDADHGLFDASSIVLNPAMGAAGREFANAVALVESPLDPPAMLAALKAMERGFGRRAGRRWGDRVLDLDIVGWSGGRFASRGLSIPHPQTPKRRFVLAPLAQIAPHWRLPGIGTPRQALARLVKSGTGR